MKRRDFISRTSGAAVALGVPLRRSLGTSSGAGQSESAEERLALAQAERRIDGVLKTQVLEEPNGQDARVGGFISPAYGFAFAAFNAVELKNLGALYCHPGSVHYHRADLARRIDLALGWLEREQHADGTIDLPTTNFHSPPDTGFVVIDLVLLYRLLERDGTATARGLLPRLEKFLRRAAGAIATGGIHTPNHRWVASSALAGCYKLFGEPLYLRRIEAWLAEGIDCNADGEYTELSNAIYNPVSNRALLTMAEALDRPELLDPVRRNLTMMLYCIHMDGEVVTDYSRRQDKLVRAWPGNYYLHYRVMATRDGDGRMATMADRIVRQSEEHPEQVSLASELAELMLRPELRGEKVVRAPLPDNYLRHFRESDVVRLRRGSLSATIVAKSSRFLSARSGGVVLEAVRLAGSFFGKGQFVGSRIEKDGESFVLRQDLEAGYYQPFSAGEGIPQPNWEKLDRSRRQRSHICQLKTEVRLTPIEGGFEISIGIDGTDRVPVALEFWFRPGGELIAGEGGELVAANGTTFLVGGSAKYRLGNSGQVGPTGPGSSAGPGSWTIGPGRADHRWANLRGAEPPIEGAVPLTIAGFTPFRHRLRLVASA